MNQGFNQMKKPNVQTPNTSIGGNTMNNFQKGPGMNNMNNNMNNLRGSNMNNMNPGNNMNNMNGMGDETEDFVEEYKNRAEFTSDPNDGGFQWRKPPMTPGLAFNTAVKNTPDHGFGKYVLPWDNRQCDYVYKAADKDVFKGALSMKSFKEVIFLNSFFTIFGAKVIFRTSKFHSIYFWKNS